MTFNLEGRNAIITGASQGLGLAIALKYVEAGAGVVLCARDPDALEKARAKTAALAKAGQTVLALKADVSVRSDTEKLVSTALRVFPRLHILINNAGIYGPMGPIEEIDWNAWKKTLEINLFGSVYLCRLVLKHFKAHRYGKIIQISGGGATGPLPRISAYAASKAAVVRFAETLAEEVQTDHINVNAIAPGALNTRLLDEVLAAGAQKTGQAFYERALKQKTEGGTPLEKGADLAVFLGSSASDGISGKLISATWDSWRSLPNYLDNLRNTDVYTLRRIVPKDRGMMWDKT